jgi:hypothetical protein
VSAAEQFAAYQAIYEASCAIASQPCGTSFSLWRGWLFWPAVGLLMGAFSWLAAPRLRAWVEARTERRWLQALLFAVPVALGWALIKGGLAAWDFVPPPSNHRCYTAPPIPQSWGGLDPCTGFPPTVLGEAWQSASNAIWLVIPIAVVLWLALLGLRRVPRWLWLLPALLWTVQIGAQWNDSLSQNQLDPANSIAQAISPLLSRQDFPMAQVRVKPPFAGSSPAIVTGFGSAHQIELSWSYVNPHLLHGNQRNGLTIPAYSAAAWRAIIGHELAHVRRHHNVLNFGVPILFGMVLCWFGWWWTRRIADHWRRLCSYAAILMAALPVQALVLNAVITVTEYQADHIGFDIAREPDGFAEMALIEALGGRMELSFVERWLVTYHPSPGERIRMAIAWQRANRPDQPLRVPSLEQMVRRAAPPGQPVRPTPAPTPGRALR